ncbi:MAG: zinc ABC transporter substrate-binding protein [Epsilonproteobacteria bacterium]|nr:zinc ABC transporter substrate-binding protein [Campylobacterota bacterium]
MSRFKTLLAVGIAVLLIGFFMLSRIQEPMSPSHKVVSVTTFALYDIVRNLAPKDVEVYMVLPFGADIHAYEPTPKSMAKIESSLLLISSGAGLEPWLESVGANQNHIDVSRHVNLLHNEHGCEHEGHHNDAHESRIDPHYWLSIKNMKSATELIASLLEKEFSHAKESIETQKNIYIKKLDELDMEYRVRIQDCEQERIFVNHNAFGYLAHEYHFEVESLLGLSSDEQPSAKRMSELASHVREDHIKTIFFESFSNSKAMQSVADELHVNIEVLEPLANVSEKNAQSSYIDLMQQNLDKIAKALECR